MPTYVNSQSFYDGHTMQKRGDANPSPTDSQIRAGLVREVKITPPAEVKSVRKQRKPKHQTKSRRKLD